MVEKFGSDQAQLATYGGGVISEDGATLVSGESNGSNSLLFGPAALREIQSGIANSDFAVPPPDVNSDINDASNPLPYWSLSAGSGWSAKSVASSDFFGGNGSGRSVRFTCAPSTPLDRAITLTRITPIASNVNRAFSYYPELYVAVGSSSTIGVNITVQFLTATFTSTGSSFGRVSSTVAVGLYAPTAPSTTMAAPADAAFAQVTITFTVNAVAGSGLLSQNFTVSECRLVRGDEALLVSELTTPGTYAPALIQQTNGVLTLTPATSAAIATSAAVTGNITATGNIGVAGQIYGSTALTGPNLQLAGTNNQLWSFSNSTGAADIAASTAGTRSGILITKSVAGQPTTNVNGTGTTDAFADALRNGGLASDNTNARLYVYNGGAWKYAALTTPSDSRLKTEITSISDALGKLKQLIPVAFKWKRPEAHPRTDAVADDGSRLGFIADQVATTDLKHWVEDMGVGDIEHDLVEDTDGRVLAVNIPQNEIEALIVQALIDIDARLKALEGA